ncbi:unnamed protein product, partial [Iphiclides podalirius]
MERENVIECTCYTNSVEEIENQNRGQGKKLKKVRAGKHGYRWCRDVDPRHTYFGYSYGRHERVSYKGEEEKKIKITDTKRKEGLAEVTDAKKNVPVFEKKLGKLSLDCCSAVGGMTINVETLGEDKGKFLVQVVSHSSKEDTVLIGGVVCESVYVCLGVSHAIVNGRAFFVEKVERHIIEPSGNIHQTLLVLTLKGYVVSQEWANNSYIIHINPLLRVIPERDEIEPHEPLRETWREDLQLLSDYLDFKSTRSSEGARYVSEHGELTGTIRDYLQALLLLRPNDALHFTRHYFGAALSALDLPHNEFFDSSTKHVRYYFFEE